MDPHVSRTLKEISCNLKVFDKISFLFIYLFKMFVMTLSCSNVIPTVCIFQEMYSLKNEIYIYCICLYVYIYILPHF